MEQEPRIYQQDKLDLGNRISNLVLSEFLQPSSIKSNDKLLKLFRNGKPKSDLNEFTVLAGLVALIPQTPLGEEPALKKRKLDDGSDNFHLQLLTISSGLKCIPTAKIEELSHGRMIHDSHAEILSIRLFNKLLLEEMRALKKNKSVATDFDLLESNSNGKFKLKDPKTKFVLYISEIPCGDASLENTQDKSESKEIWTEVRSDDNIVRGRNNFGMVGIVRTKPGRKDSQISYSKSCSDKICIKQFTGLLNSTTYDLFDKDSLDSMKLSYLVQPKAKIKAESFQRCFCSRFYGELDVELRNTFKPICVIPTSNEFEFAIEDGKKATNLSILHIPKLSFVQVLNNGVKNGCPSKKIIKKKDQTEISRERLIELRNEITAVCVTDYHSFKRKVVQLRKIKSKVKNILGGWDKTSNDNFTLKLADK